MSKNRVPTQEELEAQAQKDQEELAELETKDKEEKEKDVEEVKKSIKEIEKNKDSESEDQEELEEEEVSEEEDNDQEEEVSEEEVVNDHKKKFIESQREAKVLHSKVKGFEKASEIKPPTDDEMKKEYEDWEDLSDFEKKIAKNDWVNTKRNEAIDAVVAESKNVDEWNNKVDAFIDDPGNLVKLPKLEGKLDDFKIFASKPSRRGVDFEDLVKAFLFDVEEKRPAKKKGKMFETGSGGPSKKSKIKTKLTIDEGVKLKNSNYEEYKRQLLAGNIEDDFS